MSCWWAQGAAGRSLLGHTKETGERRSKITRNSSRFAKPICASSSSIERGSSLISSHLISLRPRRPVFSPGALPPDPGSIACSAHGGSHCQRQFHCQVSLLFFFFFLLCLKEIEHLAICLFSPNCDPSCRRPCFEFPYTKAIA